MAAGVDATSAKRPKLQRQPANVLCAPQRPAHGEGAGREILVLEKVSMNVYNAYWAQSLNHNQQYCMLGAKSAIHNA